MTKSNFFMVHHEFKEGQSAGFFEWMGGLKPEDWTKMAEKNLSLNVWNHSFAPSGLEGPCFCYWEAKDGMSKEDFQAFIDGPDGPGAGATFVNTVYLIPNDLIGDNTPYPRKFTE